MYWQTPWVALLTIAWLLVAGEVQAVTPARRRELRDEVRAVSHASSALSDMPRFG